MRPGPSPAWRSPSTAGINLSVPEAGGQVVGLAEGTPRSACRLALATGTEIGEPRRRPLGADSNWQSAPGTRLAASPMDRRALTGERCQEIPSHELPGRRIDAAQRRLIEFCGRRPGIEPQRPQCLALIDVAYAGADALLEEQFVNAGGLRSAGAPDHFIQVERIDEDVWPQVADRQALVDDQLHEGRGKAHGNGFREGQHGS